MAELFDIAYALKAKKVGNGYSAKCPAHDDSNPSLSLSEGPDGKVLFYCHAGCSQDSVINALKERNILGGQNRPNSVSAASKKLETSVSKESSIIATSVVNDFHTNLQKDDRAYLISERLLSETVIDKYLLGTCGNRISIPIRNGKGHCEDMRLYLRKDRRARDNSETQKMLHFRKGYGAARIFPFDQLQNNDVLLVEGEFDALAAISHGLNAVTTTAGAKVWREENTQALVGKNVTIVMDNDDAGQVGTQKRASALVDIGCRVRVVQWPADRPGGHDITDELKNFGVESLRSIIDSGIWISGSHDAHPPLICLSDVEIESVDWLWFPYIGIGKLTMIEGDPGLGKSWITLAIATHVSLGLGLPGLEQCAPGNVLLMSCEDGLGDTIKPRLVSLGADHSKIFAPSEIFTFDELGIEILKKYIEQKKPKLIIVDPIVAYMGGKIDMNRANETRQLMAKLGDLAAHAECAILMLRHLTKSSSDKSIYRGIGSIDLTGACRSVILVGADANDRSKRALIHIKCNLAEMGVSQGYAVEDNKFIWTGPSSLTACDILAAEQVRSNRKSSLEGATEFLEGALMAGERAQTDIDEEAEGAGISKTTLYRAKKELGIVARRVGEKGSGRGKAKWYWRLPDQLPECELDSQDFLDRQDPGMGILDILIEKTSKSDHQASETWNGNEGEGIGEKSE